MPKLPLLVSALYFLLVGCSSTPAKIQPPLVIPTAGENSESGWWYARFRMHWPKQTGPAWQRDVQLAHRVVLPVLNQYRDQIDIWRFHRRAARDGAGHQFSFIFYARPDTAAKIYQAIEVNEILKELMEAGTVEQLILDNPKQIKKPHIEDTSDPIWNEIVQKSWPLYIMGVSEMWLDMINRLVIYNQEKVTDQEELYLHIQSAITLVWENEGSHAFLHHLNGLFAYKPIGVMQRKMMNF